MRKGKFGILLSFYAILAFICVVLKQPIICAILFALSVFLEKDEWTGRQTLQAFLMSLVVAFTGTFLPWLTSLIPDFLFFSKFIHTSATVFSVIVYAVAIVFSVLGILRVMKDEEADIPLFSEISYRAYGKVKPRAVHPMPGQYPPPYVQQIPPQEAQPIQQTPPDNSSRPQ